MINRYRLVDRNGKTAKEGSITGEVPDVIITLNQQSGSHYFYRTGITDSCAVYLEAVTLEVVA